MFNSHHSRELLICSLNDNLEATAQAIFQEQFASYYGLSELPEGWKLTNLENLCTVKGGKRLPADCELLNTPTNHPYIRVRDVGNSRYVCLTDQFQYIDEETHYPSFKHRIYTSIQLTALKVGEHRVD